jgi:hypothetical protein
MSIGSINSGSSNWWTCQYQATQATQSPVTTASDTASGSTNAISNTGTTAGSANFSSFLQAFSADLQAMLTQMGSATADSSASSTAATTSTATTSATTASDAATATQTASNDAQDGVHHHHHHHEGGEGGGGQGDSLQGTANQLVGAIGQSLQNGTITASGISNAVSLLATDLTQAMQAYGSNNTASSASTTLV